MTDADKDRFYRELCEAHGKAMTTAEMQELYTVVGFAAPYVVVYRKSDGVRGSLQFTHHPRFYHSFQEG